MPSQNVVRRTKSLVGRDIALHPIAVKFKIPLKSGVSFVIGRPRLVQDRIATGIAGRALTVGRLASHGDLIEMVSPLKRSAGNVKLECRSNKRLCRRNFIR